MKHCYDCKYDVRGEDGIMTGCAHPTEAAYCTASAAHNGERPAFEPKHPPTHGNTPESIRFLKEGAEGE